MHKNYKWIYEFSWNKININSDQTMRLLLGDILNNDDSNFDYIDKLISDEVINEALYIRCINMYIRTLDDYSESFLYLYKQLGMPDTDDKKLTEYRDKTWNRKKSAIQN